MLSNEEVVAIVRKHVESKFPKWCSCCGRRFDSLADYLRGTTHLGNPISGDNPYATAPASLIGTIAYANCSCGSTLTISSAGLDLLTMGKLLQWAGANMSRRGLTIGEILKELRTRIDDAVLGETTTRASG